MNMNMNVVGLVIAFMLVMQLGSCALIRPAQPALDKKTAERITQLRKDMLLRRARALVQYEPIYQELETLLPQDHGAADDIRRYKSERRDLADSLYDCGHESMLEKNYAQAEECLELSNKLVSYGEKQALLEKARSIRRQQDDKRRSEQIMAAYQQAYSTGNLAEARVQLDMMIALTAENTNALALRDKLDGEIKLKMTRDLEVARSLYSRGKISEALAICNSLMIVDPKNKELLSLMSRAEKVNKNIEKLSKTKR